MTTLSSTNKISCFSRFSQAVRSCIADVKRVKKPQNSDYQVHLDRFHSLAAHYYPHHYPSKDTAPQPAVSEVAAAKEAVGDEVAAAKEEATGNEVTVADVIEELTQRTSIEYSWEQSLEVRKYVAEYGRSMHGNGHHKIFLEALAIFLALDYNKIGFLPDVYWEPKVVAQWFAKYSREVEAGNPAHNPDRVIPYGCKKWRVLKRMHKAYLAEQATANN